MDGDGCQVMTDGKFLDLIPKTMEEMIVFGVCWKKKKA